MPYRSARVYPAAISVPVELAQLDRQVPLVLETALAIVGARVYAIDPALRVMLVSATATHDVPSLQPPLAGAVAGTQLLDYALPQHREALREACAQVLSGSVPEQSCELDCSVAARPQLCKVVIAAMHAGQTVVGAIVTCWDLLPLSALEPAGGSRQRPPEALTTALQLPDTRAQVLQRIAEVLSETQSPQARMRAIATVALSELHAQGVIVYALAEDGRVCAPLTSRGLDPADLPLDLSGASDRLAGQSLTMRRPLVADAARVAGMRFPRLESGPVRAAAAMPIRGPDGDLGVLAVYRAQPEPFDGAQLALLGALADQAALAMRRAAQPVPTSRGARLLHLLNYVGERLASEVDESRIVQLVTEPLVAQLGLAFGRIWLFDGARDELVLRSSAGLYTDTGGEFSRIRLGQHAVGRIAATRLPLVSNDAPNTPGIGGREWALATGIRGFAGYPLVARERLIGVIAFFSRAAIDAELVAMLEPLAHQAALALERAQLYVAQDVARREAQALAAVATSRATQLSATLTAMTDGVWTCDQQGRLLTVNNAALRMFGFDPTHTHLSVLGDIERLFAPECADREVCFGLRAALDGRTMRGELVLQPALRRRALVTVSATATPMRDDAGNVVGAVAVVQDVTQQKAFDRLKDDFLSMAAHELRTPVTAIKGYAQLALMRLKAGGDTRLLQRALQTIETQAERIAHLVGELVDTSRIQGGHFELRRTPIDLVALVRGSIEQIQARTQHQLTLEAPPTLLVPADDLRLEQVLQNLLDNAVKYSPNGGRIETVVRLVDGSAQVTVRDYGIGIAREKQPHVFDAWFQAHSDTVGDYGGMGLGLSICKEIIERHGGRIWVESTEGQGCVFGFTLPLRADDRGGTPSC